MKNVIDIGQTLPKETWVDAAANIRLVAPAIANILRRTNHDGQGERDAAEFMADMHLAHWAMLYVAEFARDKCRVIVVPEAAGGTE